MTKEKVRSIAQGDVIRCMRDCFGWKQAPKSEENSIQKELSTEFDVAAVSADISNLINMKKNYFANLQQANWQTNQKIAVAKKETYKMVEEHFYAVFIKDRVNPENMQRKWKEVKGFLAKGFGSYSLEFETLRTEYSYEEVMQLEEVESEKVFKNIMLDILECGLNNTKPLPKTEKKQITETEQVTETEPITETEKNAIRNLLLLPDDGIPDTLLINLKAASAETLTRLEQDKWIVIDTGKDGQEKVVKLCPNVRDRFFEELKPNFETCEEFLTEVQRFSKKQLRVHCHQYDRILSSVFHKIFKQLNIESEINQKAFSFVKSGIYFFEFCGCYEDARNLLSRAFVMEGKLDPTHREEKVWEELENHHKELCKMLGIEWTDTEKEKSGIDRNDTWENNLRKMEYKIREVLQRKVCVDIEELNRIENDLQWLLVSKMGPECSETTALEAEIQKRLEKEENKSDFGSDIRRLLICFKAFYEFRYRQSNNKEWMNLSVRYSELVLLIDEKNASAWQTGWELTVLDSEDVGFVCLNDLQNPQKAKVYYDQAEKMCIQHGLTHHPVYAKVLFRLGEWYCCFEGRKKARESLEKAISILHSAVGENQVLMQACQRLLEELQ